MTPIAEERLKIKLDRERELIFDANTMRAYERASGKKYWKTMLSLFDFAERQNRELPADLPDGKRSIAQATRMGLNMLAEISVDELATMLWAACHEYKGKKTVHPLEIDEICQYLRPQDTSNILNLIVRGHQANSPTREQLGEASGAGSQTTENPAEANPETSGQPSIELPADAFA